MLSGPEAARLIAQFERNYYEDDDPEILEISRIMKLAKLPNAISSVKCKVL